MMEVCCIERTTLIVENEAACKLFDCFVAYNKLANKFESLEASAIEDHLTIEMSPTPELVEVEAEHQTSFKRAEK